IAILDCGRKRCKATKVPGRNGCIAGAGSKAREAREPGEIGDIGLIRDEWIVSNPGLSVWPGTSRSASSAERCDGNRTASHTSKRFTNPATARSSPFGTAAYSPQHSFGNVV